MYKSIEAFTLPFYDLTQPFKDKIQITEGEIWKLKNVKNNIYTMTNRKEEWIEIPEEQFKKCFEEYK